MNKIALIPARGGSKRIPRKNIRNFLGKPIIAYTIEAAQKSECFDRIVVSTDCPEIKAIAEQYGAEVPFMRPEKQSDDHATTVDVIKHALIWFQKNHYAINLICCLYATAPFIKPKYIKLGMQKLMSSEKSTYAFTVTSFPSPIQRALKLNNDSLEMFNPELLNTRSQDLEEAYHDAGQFYWGKPEAFLTDIPLYCEKALPIILPQNLVQDIDTEEDWVQAELMYTALIKAK